MFLYPAPLFLTDPNWKSFVVHEDSQPISVQTLKLQNELRQVFGSSKSTFAIDVFDQESIQKAIETDPTVHIGTSSSVEDLTAIAAMFHLRLMPFQNSYLLEPSKKSRYQLLSDFFQMLTSSNINMDDFAKNGLKMSHLPPGARELWAGVFPFSTEKNSKDELSGSGATCGFTPVVSVHVPMNGGGTRFFQFALGSAPETAEDSVPRPGTPLVLSVGKDGSLHLPGTIMKVKNLIDFAQSTFATNYFCDPKLLNRELYVQGNISFPEFNKLMATYCEVAPFQVLTSHSGELDRSLRQLLAAWLKANPNSPVFQLVQNNLPNPNHAVISGAELIKLLGGPGNSNAAQIGPGDSVVIDSVGIDFQAVTTDDNGTYSNGENLLIGQH